MLNVLVVDGGGYVQNGYGLAMTVVAVLSLAVGVWVVIREQARRISLLLLVSSLAIALYLLAFSYLVRAVNAEAAYGWSRVAYVGIPLIVPSLYHFSIDLLGLGSRRRGLVSAAWVVGFVYLALAQGTSLLIPGVIETHWGYYTKLSAWNLPFLAWSLLLLGLVMRDYWNAYAGADPVQRARIRWLAIPMTVASIGFLDYLPSLGVDLPPVGFAFLAAFPLAAAWVVARYHLPDLTPAFAAHQILTTMVEPLLVVDQLGRIAITNPAASRLLGWPQDAMEGQHLATLLGTDTADRLTGSHGLRADYMEITARTGEPVAVSVSTAELTEKGRVVGTVIVARDIRDRIRAARRLERREQYFRALIENARDTITVLDEDGRIRYQSPSHAEVLGRAPGQDVGREPFNRVHPDERAEVMRLFAELMATPGGITRMEVRLRHDDGRYRTLDLRAQNLLDNPSVRGVVVNGRDITDERALSERLREAQKLEAIGRLAGGVAHDFNNILTTIQGSVSLMLDEGAADEGYGEELSVIQRGAERAGRLTSQLLAFSRRQLTRPETFDLSELILDLRSGFDQIVGQGTELVVTTDPEPATIRMDRSQLERALLDLVIHAEDAVDGAGRVELATENVRLDEDRLEDIPIQPGRYVRLTVRDDGDGMDEATRARIFEPFFTAKSHEPSEGLGLASVYGTVRQAGGHIEVASRPGDGTTFRIYLPRVDGEPTVPSDAASEPRPEPAGEQILVVEDEAPVRQLIRKVLERHGYRVLTAADGDEALAVAGDWEGEIDLLIADLVMPGMSGREVAERLKRVQPELAIILISGFTADDLVRAGIEQGDYVFLPKPFNPETLTTRVAEVLRARTTD